MEDKEFVVERIQTENNNPTYKVTTSKLKSTYTVKKSNDGFVFFEITQDVGVLPASLTGRFTKPEKALEIIKQYVSSVKPSKAIKRDENTKAREKRKQQNAKAKTQSDNKEHVQQGLTD